MRRKHEPVRPALRTALTALLCAMIVIACEWSGVTRAIDDKLAARWVQLRGQLDVGANDAQSVVVVAVDEQTQAAWGPGPWSRDRAQQLLARIEAAEPRFVASVGHAQPLDFPVSARVFAHAPGTAWDRGGLIHGQLDDEAGSFAQLAARVGHVSLDGRVPVFWRPAATIPVLSAVALERCAIAAEQLRGRIVLIGQELPSYTPRVETAVGALSPTMIEAHALHGLLNTPAAPAQPPWWRPGLACIICLLTLASIRLMTSWSSRLGVLAVLVSLCLAADFAGASYGWLEMGTGLQLLVLGSFVAVHAGLELMCMQRGLGALQREILDDRMRHSDVDEVTFDEEDEEFWLGLARFAATFVDSRAQGASSRVYARVPSSMALRGFVATQAGDEARCGAEDLRRAPFRRAWQSLSTSASAGPSQRGETLVIPLAVDDRCLGMWRIDLPAQSSAELRVELERFAQRLSHSMAKREAQRQLAAGPQQSIRGRIELVLDGFELAHVQQRASLELLEELPVPIMIATVWGEAQFISEQMCELLRGREQLPAGDARAQGSELFRLICMLTENSPSMVRKMMGRVAVTGLTLELGADRDSEHESERMWMLSRVNTEAGRDHLVLSARPRPELEGAPTSGFDSESAATSAPRRRAAR